VSDTGSCEPLVFFLNIMCQIYGTSRLLKDSGIIIIYTEKNQEMGDNSYLWFILKATLLSSLIRIIMLSIMHSLWNIQLLRDKGKITAHVNW